MKRCSMSFVTRELHIKHQCHPMPIRMVRIQKTNNINMAGKYILIPYQLGCKILQTFCKTVFQFLKKPNTDLPSALPVSLIGIQKTYFNLCTQKNGHVNAYGSFFHQKIMRNQKQPRCPPKDKWINTVLYFHRVLPRKKAE